MTLDHIEQLEWGVCLIVWCYLCGCFCGWSWRNMLGDEPPIFHPSAQGAICCLMFFITPAALGIYAGVYAAWRT